MHQGTRDLVQQLETLNGIQLEYIDTEEANSAYFIPENSHAPLVITWGKHDEVVPQIKLVYGLGKIPQDIPGEVVLEMLTLNLVMASYIGPKLSYSKQTQMLTLITCISPVDPEPLNAHDLHEEIKLLIEQGTLIYNKLYELGYPLLDAAE